MGTVGNRHVGNLTVGTGDSSSSRRAHPTPRSPRIPPAQLPFRWERSTAEPLPGLGRQGVSGSTQSLGAGITEKGEMKAEFGG